jgi:hypothetical protein
VEDGDAAANEGASSDDDDMDGSESDGAADERDDAGLGREVRWACCSVWLLWRAHVASL